MAKSSKSENQKEATTTKVPASKEKKVVKSDLDVSAPKIEKDPLYDSILKVVSDAKSGGFSFAYFNGIISNEIKDRLANDGIIVGITTRESKLFKTSLSW